jgi:HTH-type transcriptional regulator/antitoxin HigA
MTTARSRRFRGKVRDDYLELEMKFPLTSVHSEEEIQATQEVMDALLAQGKLSAGKELYLDALSDLVAAYEDEHYRIQPASDAEMLRHLMESRGTSQAELQRSTKIPKSTISEILSGKKSFSRQLVRTLADFFNVDKSVLAHNL